jgi:hypothetical protein
MADEERRKEARSEEEAEEDDLLSRFPETPETPKVPEVPKFEVKLPPHSSKTQPGGMEPGAYGKMGIAFTAATSFIMPVIVLSVGGWWLDQKLHHTTAWLAFVGVLLGLATGVISLINVMNKLSK